MNYVWMIARGAYKGLNNILLSFVYFVSFNFGVVGKRSSFAKVP